ncbi:uncharacterized protein LOC129005480 isoform X2 [Macrosteles quadrilineatus]|uniref:uncharacterized protein LOC129005480 isoform X2 n=1 Tax=Macrosteles quadrilineatus TaxID=74068 RepID=UPI0023E317DC|nr:uncharacterized protein LOC129005480 isoform X2 [Macrosteles quadrilineatus]
MKHELSYCPDNLESDKVCSYKHLVRNRINAGYDGLVVRENSYFDSLSGKHSFSCKFEVEAGSKKRGLFVVMQNLRLRQDKKTGDCIDYVQLRQVDKDFISENLNINLNLKKNPLPWVTFCGDLKAQRDGNLENEKSTDLAVTGFVSDYYAVEVEIFISKLPILNDKIELEMIFTPYLTCKNTWSEYRDCGMDKCIKKQNFKDGWVNCPYLNCPDEEGCSNSTSDGKHNPPELRNLTLTAVTSVFCSFFLFLLLIWCCRYFELLCWGANTLLGRPNPVELSPMNRRAPSPSAPPPDTSAKDLPPSYETLFPDR